MESSRDDSMSDIKDIVCSTTGLDSPVSGDCSLSQSEIQSVLDSVFGGSFPSLFDAPKEKDSDQTSTKKNVLNGVHLRHLLHAELSMTTEALPSTMQAYVSCSGIVSHVDDENDLVSLYIYHESSPLNLSLSSRNIQYLIPTRPREGDTVRVIKGRNAGLKGCLYICGNQYLIESTAGTQVVDIKELVRLSHLTSCPPPLHRTSARLCPSPPPSRPLTLAVPDDTWPLQQYQHEEVYSPIERPASFDHTPSPSLSPASPWSGGNGVPYSPQETDLTPISPGYYPNGSYHVNRSYHCPPVSPRTTVPPQLLNSPTCYIGYQGPYYRQPICQYLPGKMVAVQTHTMAPPRPPPPCYQGNPSAPSRVRTPCPPQRSLPVSYNREPNVDPIQSAQRVPPRDSNGISFSDELKTLTCGKNSMTKVTSGCHGRPAVSIELLIEKVVNNLLTKEPPDHWYSPSTRTVTSDELCTESVSVSAICPITKQKMEYPSRGLYCTHLQCFDAKVFLQLALKKHRPHKTDYHPVSWRCPVCSKTICPKQLFIDKYLKKTLETTDVTDLQCQGRGNWIPIEKTDQVPLSSVIDLTLDSDDGDS